MASLPKVIDIEDAPDLVRLVQEVRETHDEVVIRQGGEDVVIISPAKADARRLPEREITEADIEAALSAQGSWKGLIDIDAFLKDNYESRDRSTRPPVDR